MLTLSAKQPLIMGILNVTPDSFSDGGCFTDINAIRDQAAKMVSEGADILDIGGESTRPFSEPVSIEDELARVLPAIRTVRERYSLPISIDTTKAAVARQALAAGADIINDISALTFDPEMVVLAREAGCPVIIMHMQGNPKTMQIAPQYDDVVSETFNYLKERVNWLRRQGISQQIVIDPGVGFGKAVRHNLSLIKNIGRFRQLDCPVLIGHSRKSFLGKLLGLDINDRDEATAILSAFCALNGAHILRVHDVARTRKAVQLALALRDAC
jgi:dihydropteroate synthase